VDRSLQDLERRALASPGDRDLQREVGRRLERAGRPVDAYMLHLRAGLEAPSLAAALRDQEREPLAGLPSSYRRQIRLAGARLEAKPRPPLGYRQSCFRAFTLRRGPWPLDQPSSLERWLAAATGPVLCADLRAARIVSGPTIARLNALPCLRLLLLGRLSPGALSARLTAPVTNLLLDRASGDDAFRFLRGSSIAKLDLLSSTETTAAALAQLAALPALEHLRLGGPQPLRAADLRSLGTLRALRTLDLGFRRPSQRGWDALTTPTLEGLRMRTWRTTALPKLGLPGLRRLDASSSLRLNDLSGLLEAPALSHLDLSACPALGSGSLALLARLPLVLLALDDCPQLGDAELEILSQHPTLETLSLRGCPLVTNEGVRRLGASPSLRRLSLNRCGQVTDAGLAALARLNLTRLDLRRLPRVTARGRGLVAHIPGLRDER
jgi:Leucine Rich repeat